MTRSLRVTLSVVIAGVGMITCPAPASAENQHGTSGPDHLVGTRNAEIIYGMSGDDILEGRDGPDLLKGDSGDDSVFGEGGPDYLFGDKGDDLLSGGPGHDDLRPGAGADTVYGGSSDGTSDDEITLTTDYRWVLENGTWTYESAPDFVHCGGGHDRVRYFSEQVDPNDTLISCEDVDLV